MPYTVIAIYNRTLGHLFYFPRILLDRVSSMCPCLETWDQTSALLLLDGKPRNVLNLFSIYKRRIIIVVLTIELKSET